MQLGRRLHAANVYGKGSDDLSSTFVRHHSTNEEPVVAAGARLRPGGALGRVIGLDRKYRHGCESCVVHLPSVVVRIGDAEQRSFRKFAKLFESELDMRAEKTVVEKPGRGDAVKDR